MENQKFVSSVKDKYARAKLNNVIDSLSCFVSNTTNDKTKQDYGTINYCGVLELGMKIKGDKIPASPGVVVTGTLSDGTPIVVGTINQNGELVVEDTIAYRTTQSIQSGISSINMSVSIGAGNNCYNCYTATKNCECCSSNSGVADGWNYTTYCTCIQCTYMNCYKTCGLMGVYRCALPDYITTCQHFYWCTCYDYGNNKCAPALFICYDCGSGAADATNWTKNKVYACINESDGRICWLLPWWDYPARNTKITNNRYWRFQNNEIGLFVYGTSNIVCVSSTYCCNICRTVCCKNAAGCQIIINQRYV